MKKKKHYFIPHTERFHSNPWDDSVVAGGCSKTEL